MCVVVVVGGGVVGSGPTAAPRPQCGAPAATTTAGRGPAAVAQNWFAPGAGQAPESALLASVTPVSAAFVKLGNVSYEELCGRLVDLDESTRCVPDAANVAHYADQLDQQMELTNTLFGEKKATV